MKFGEWRERELYITPKFKVLDRNLNEYRDEWGECEFLDLSLEEMVEVEEFLVDLYLESNYEGVSNSGGVYHVCLGDVYDWVSKCEGVVIPKVSDFVVKLLKE